MPKKIAVLIGTGGIAREHLTVLSGMPEVEVAAVCDLSAARAEATADRFHLKKWFTNYIDMINAAAPDFVHITTPPASHYDLSRACLEMGLNVFCEKPITSSYEQFQTLRKLANDKNVLLIENQNYRFHSSVQSICKYIGSGKLGKVVEVQVQVHLDIHAADSVYLDPNVAHYSATMKGGVVGDFLTHISYLAQLFVGRSVKVASTWRNFSNDSVSQEDEFRAILKGENCSAYVGFSGNAQPNGFWLRVIGTKGQVEANLFEPPRISFRKLRGQAPPTASLIDGVCESRDVLTGAFAALWRKFAGTGRYDGLEGSIRSCYLALNSGQPLSISLDQIDDSCRLVEMLTSDEHRI